MKKSSVLIRRAALFTATVMAVTVAVSMCAYIAGTWIQLNVIARGQLRPQAEYLSGLVGTDNADPSKLQDAAGMLYAGGGYAWLVRRDADAVNPVVGNAPWPEESLRTKKNPLRPTTVRINGRLYAYCESAVRDGADAPHVGVALPIRGVGLGLSLALIAVLVSICCGILAGKLFIKRMLRPALEPVARLRDAAVAMADGHLDTRADDRVDGELGQLGKALNHLSDQLSRSMVSTTKTCT